MLFLPPLLTSAAYYSSIRDLRYNARPIALLSIGLVLVTTAGVAFVAHHLVGMPWEAAFVLGAVLGRPTPSRPRPSRDGSARRGGWSPCSRANRWSTTPPRSSRSGSPSPPSSTGSFSLVDAVGEFGKGIVGGIAIGIAVGALIVELLRRIEDPPTEAVLTLLLPYFAYLPAEALHLSAVVAAVTAGIYSAMRAPRTFTPTSRLQINALWELMIFLLNGALFVLVGLQLPEIIDALDGYSVGEVARLRGRRDRHGGRHPLPLGLPGGVAAAAAVAARPRARPMAGLAGAVRHRLHRHARRGLAGRGALASRRSSRAAASSPSAT